MTPGDGYVFAKLYHVVALPTSPVLSLFISGNPPECFLFFAKSKSEFEKWKTALDKQTQIVEEDAANGFLIPNYIRWEWSMEYKISQENYVIDLSGVID